ncbi:hypothetical protein WJX74_004356 [Apatococcus lobatus]|uniref:Uncharacterized protein n=1 Tax=Apatococcus lobatus TaxID=904363 RepID=A0AAW1Q2P2_9CHLO
MRTTTRAHSQTQGDGEVAADDWAQRIDAQDATIAAFDERMGGIESLLRSIAANQQTEQQLRAAQAEKSRETDDRGPSLGGGLGVTDPEDQAILKDLRTQTLKELRKAAASKQNSRGKGSKGGDRPEKGNHKPQYQKKTNQGPAQQGSGSA